VRLRIGPEMCGPVDTTQFLATHAKRPRKLHTPHSTVAFENRFPNVLLSGHERKRTYTLVILRSVVLPFSLPVFSHIVEISLSMIKEGIETHRCVMGPA